jgi:beta-lactamase regulating signal transducer with metallopeptidase domain
MTAEPLMLSLGWTLLHSLWQLGAIALVLYALLRLLSGYRAESRYLLACTALALCLLAPLATFSYLYQPVVAPQTPNLSPQETMVENQAESAVSEATVQTPASPRPAQSAAESPAITSPATPRTVPQPQLAPLQRLLPYLVISWLFGVTLLSLKLCLDLIYVSRVRRRSTPVAGGLMQQLESLKRRIGISRTVCLLQTKLCDSPSIIGIFRPVVLLPVSVMTGLSEEQLTAILLHELAHIRRHDYLINLLQSIIETLLFYHPAVWWVSGQIRAEREYACDDMVVRLGSHPVSYARALAELESLRHTSKLAMAASHTNLTGRVKRLLGASQVTPARGLAGVALLTVLSALLFAALSVGAQAQAATLELPEVWLTIHPHAEFTDDTRRIVSLPEGGFAILESWQHGVRQRWMRVEQQGEALLYTYAEGDITVTRTDDWQTSVAAETLLSGNWQDLPADVRAWFEETLYLALPVVRERLRREATLDDVAAAQSADRAEVIASRLPNMTRLAHPEDDADQLPVALVSIFSGIMQDGELVFKMPTLHSPLESFVAFDPYLRALQDHEAELRYARAFMSENYAAELARMRHLHAYGVIDELALYRYLAELLITVPELRAQVAALAQEMARTDLRTQLLTLAAAIPEAPLDLPMTSAERQRRRARLMEVAPGEQGPSPESPDAEGAHRLILVSASDTVRLTEDAQVLSFIRQAADTFDNPDFRADILQRISDLE